MKQKQCRLCKEYLPLTSFTSTQAHYCNNCRIIRKLEQQKASALRQLERSKKKKPKTELIRLSDLKKVVQRKVNKYIRQRDRDDGCISCGSRTAKSYEAGHFIAQGSSGFLRYNFDNIHKQCYSCNHFKHANLIEYRINLVKKIGLKRVEYLENNRRNTKQWTREELNQILEEL